MAGIITMGHKRTGYGRSLCKHCSKVTLSERITNQGVALIHFVPIPIGSENLWRCTECGKDPLNRMQSSSGVLTVGAVFIGVFALVLIVCGYPNDPEVLRFGILFMVLSLLLSVTVQMKKWEEQRNSKLMEPNPDTVCPFCEGKIEGTPPSCVGCGVKRL